MGIIGDHAATTDIFEDKAVLAVVATDKTEQFIVNEYRFCGFDRFY